ncbi:DUF305 domain-containing protein [Streptomyces genisteinicus]|uniref:DUF305 domain-containing protein n=1 Tax=Streptomyces genisteinicus TaxID=2768068 RepID=A0A7H0HR47_9ACTN|nr:DUF305 domain-containing protein [Streptomyces genisteinicus]QNP63013.1 DUF305 domain-containing protein [Streptomyces genisteinicus]
MTRTHWAAITAVVLALLFAGAATVASAGGSPPAADTPSAASADAGFARDMSVHHQQAVEMSFLVRDGTDDEEVRRLAYDIANTQANQRGMMLGWLDLWGLPKVEAGTEPMTWMHGDGDTSGHAGHGSAHDAGDAGDAPLMPGMATKAEMAKLAGLSGEEAEIYYLQLMITHHNGGVAMAEGCVRLCEVGTERSLAQGMVDAQRSEVELMVGLLKKRGAQPRI